MLVWPIGAPIFNSQWEDYLKLCTRFFEELLICFGNINFVEFTKFLYFLDYLRVLHCDM